MTDEQKLIFEQIDMEPVSVFDWKDQLPKMYEPFNAKWFNNSLPPISHAFVCEFCDMPREFAGICIDEAWAVKISKGRVTVRLGIRINSKLKCLSDHVRIALLHEMVHASGIQKQFCRCLSRSRSLRAPKGRTRRPTPPPPHLVAPAYPDTAAREAQEPRPEDSAWPAPVPTSPRFFR